MQFLKTLFWVLVIVLAVAFSFANWVSVPVHLWGGLIADINLPFLLLLTFLLGFLPLLGFHHAVRWRQRQKIATLERTVADLRSAMAPATGTAMTETALPSPAPSMSPGIEPGAEAVVAPPASTPAPAPGTLL